MKMSLKFVLAFAYAAALCCAQSASSSGIPAKETAASLPPIQSQASTNPPAQGLPGQNDAAAQAGSPAAPIVGPPQPARKSAAQTKTPAGTAESNAGHKPYVIGPLDVLTIKVWNQPNLSGALSVGPDGMLSMQLIGEVKADGLTIGQLRDVITQRLKECCVNNPEGEVDVSVGKINSKRYYVYGGVLRGGEFPLDRDTTVMDALSLVGGFKDFANTKKIRIQRGAQEFNFNYKDVSKGKHLEENILIENGDRIFVKE
jgi:polysaccharide export outer membrane protein